MGALVWEGDVAVGADGTSYALDCEHVRPEPAAWSVLVRRPETPAGTVAERLRPEEPPWPTKRRARAVAEATERARTR